MRTRFKSASVDPIVLPSARQSNGNKLTSKRARLASTGLDSLVDRDALRIHESTDAPKTSEYAYFRNIKNRTAPANSGSLHEPKEPPKSIKPTHLTYVAETIKASSFNKCATGNLGLSPVLEQRAGPSNDHTLSSPYMNLTYKPKQKSQLLSENVTPIGQYLSLLPLQKASEISGNQCSKEGIFTANRQKLRQWVVRTSLSKVQNSVPRGSDLVASLLNRLFPKNEDSSAVHPNNSRSLPFNEPKYLGEEPQLPHGMHVDENLPRIFSMNTRSLPFNEPTYLGKGSQLPYGIDVDEDHPRISSKNGRPLPFNEPKYVEKGPQLLHGRNLAENLHTICSSDSTSLPCNEPRYMKKRPQLPHGRDLDENLLRNYFGSSTGIVHTERGTSFSRYPSVEFGSENARENDILSPNQCRNSYQSRGSHRLHGFSFDLPIERYGSSRICLGEPEEFRSSVGHAREELDKLLMEWDPKSQRSEVHSSIFNCHSSENINSCLAIPWHDEYHQMVDNMIDAKPSCSSVLPSDRYVEFDSIPTYKSSSYLIKDVEPNFEHPEYIVEEPDQFSLTLPCTSTCLSLESHRNAEDTMLHDMFSCRDQHWPQNEFWDRHDSWRKSFYATKVSVEDPSSILCTTWQFPQNETRISFPPPLQEARADSFALFSNASDSRLFPSNKQESFGASLDSLIDYPLLVTNYSSYQCGKDLYFDDNRLEEHAHLL